MTFKVSTIFTMLYLMMFQFYFSKGFNVQNGKWKTSYSNLNKKIINKSVHHYLGTDLNYYQTTPVPPTCTINNNQIPINSKTISLLPKNIATDSITIQFPVSLTNQKTALIWFASYPVKQSSLFCSDFYSNSTEFTITDLNQNQIYLICGVHKINETFQSPFDCIPVETLPEDKDQIWLTNGSKLSVVLIGVFGFVATIILTTYFTTYVIFRYTDLKRKTVEENVISGRMNVNIFD